VICDSSAIPLVCWVGRYLPTVCDHRRRDPRDPRRLRFGRCRQFSAFVSLSTCRCFALESALARSVSLPAVCDNGAPAALPTTPLMGPTLIVRLHYPGICGLNTSSFVLLHFFIVFPKAPTQATCARHFAARRAETLFQWLAVVEASC